jgi:bifunctional NMN adenylyltransferase/nudix hydrolase
VTVDAVVTQSGHVLVVERGAMPGEGLLAMPGGFVNQYESLKDAVIRELYEETKIDVPIPVLIGSIASQRIFDYPYRSLRGRTITEAYHFKLSDREYLPKIKGSDDARNARWISFNDFYFSRSMFFEDHFQIIESMLGL